MRQWWEAWEWEGGLGHSRCMAVCLFRTVLAAAAEREVGCETLAYKCGPWISFKIASERWRVCFLLKILLDFKLNFMKTRYHKIYALCERGYYMKTHLPERERVCGDGSEIFLELQQCFLTSACCIHWREEGSVCRNSDSAFCVYI